jgi:hypothetical protein
MSRAGAGRAGLKWRDAHRPQLCGTRLLTWPTVTSLKVALSPLVVMP